MSLTIISDPPSRGSDHVGVISNVAARSELAGELAKRADASDDCKIFQ